MLRADDFQKSMLVLKAWQYGEMYGQGGFLLPCIVASCIMNRVKFGWGTVLEVLDRIPAFAAELEVPKGTPTIWEPNFTRLLHEIESIYDGSMNYAKDGLFWCDLRTIETKFFREKIVGDLEVHPKVVDMNSFAVFK